jgi:hypothetical protein
MIETLAATSHRLDAKTLDGRKALAHLCTAFHPHMCGICSGIATVAVTLIGYVDVGLLSGQTRGGGDCDRLLLLR